MVKIRLKRLGAKKRPYYRLVVADARSPRDGRFIEELGTYDPVTHPATVTIDEERVRDWMRKGAQPSDTARSLLEQQGILPRTARVQKPAKESAAPAVAAPPPSLATATPTAPAAVDESAADAASPEPATAAEAAEEA